MSTTGEDYFSQCTVSELGEGTPSGDDYQDFLSRANRRIAREQWHVPDPFLDGENMAPNRPFGAHNRISSAESISSIMDEKGASSPLNKAIASVRLLSYHPLFTIHECCTVHRRGWGSGPNLRVSTPGIDPR